MKDTLTVSVDFCIIPIGVGVSLSDYIAQCQKILKDYNLSFQLHAFGTNIEGDWDTVFQAIKACHEHCHKMGAPRITTTIKCGTRTDRRQSLQSKIDSVQCKIKD